MTSFFKIILHLICLNDVSRRSIGVTPYSKSITLNNVPQFIKELQYVMYKSFTCNSDFIKRLLTIVNYKICVN